MTMTAYASPPGQVADELRPDAAATVAALQRMGVEPIMLSGDQRPTALAMAAAVGIPPEASQQFLAIACCVCMRVG